MPFSLAVLAAYATGMVVAFVLFREFVFERASTGTSEQVRNFVIVNIVGMGATWALANLLVYWALPAGRHDNARRGDRPWHRHLRARRDQLVRPPLPDLPLS